MTFFYSFILKSLSMKKILIVEDERPIARSFELKLVNAGFETKTAANGQEALALLEKEKFDLIFLDLIMPIQNGFRVLEILKSRNNATPVVVTSSLGQTVDVEHAKSLGAKDYFIKTDVGLASIVSYAKRILETDAEGPKDVHAA